MKINIIIQFCVLVLLTTSCQKFFEVTPIDRIYENELFVDRYGFETALSATYTSLADPTLYGRELSYGFVETLVGTYTNLTDIRHRYYRENRHEYTYASSQQKILSIWQNFYAVINQINIILDHLDNIKDDPYYRLIKGESLGLRAFAHFQLLKLYGPSISQEGLDVNAIIYRDKMSFETVKISTARAVIEKINLDLMEAKTLLEEDPIRTNHRTANLNKFAYEKYNSLIDRRGIRLNYYAVIALQALVAQWKNELPQAGKIAEELIAELNIKKPITLSTASDFSVNMTTNDIRTSSENIFGLHDRNLRQNSLKNLPGLSDNTGSFDVQLYPNYTWLLNNLYNAPIHGSSNDYRLANWFGNDTRWKLIKYAIPETFSPIASETNYRQVNAFEIKIISLHTIYLIAAESLSSTQPNRAMDYLNIIRRSRGLTADIPYTAALSDSDIKNLIFQEFRKENVGNGTLFTEYKRLFRPIDRAVNVAPTLGIFKLPIPVDELLYNPH